MDHLHLFGILVGSSGGYAIYFSARTQAYTVFKEGKVLISDKYSFSDVKTYIAASSCVSNH
jgi:hypothetical protein